MSIRVDLLARLVADATLAAILPGGIYDAASLPMAGLTPEAAPAAFNGARLLPCAVIRWRNLNETQIIGNSRRRFIEVYFYQQAGQAVIEQAQARCRALLHPHRQFVISGAGAQVYYTHWVEDSGELIADELDGAAMSFSRYYVDYYEGT